MSTIRLFVPGPLVAGTSIELDEARAHYLGRVMRRSEGDPVELFDGRSGGFAGRIAEIARRRVSIDLIAKLRDLPERNTAPVLFQAVIKRPRLEWLVEKATELDVGTIVPVRTRRVAAPLGRVERLATIAMEAAEQSGRLDVPEIAGETILADIGSLRRSGRSLLVLDPTAEARVADLAALHCGDLDILVGPEGGLAAEDEVELAQMPQVVRGRIAPTILRAETAALAGLAALAMLH
ncbi:RsmE family RNA methyltransferase [Geminicoccus roseus]|uniref:RsmE family RNA methyltransferase n=1 Tax=Geminicoccus roseus TaxID=404900 RepID=UPI0004000ABD|nr:RsmE family RNA methyltransferase [Geminicoccus roseus]